MPGIKNLHYFLLSYTNSTHKISKIFCITVAILAFSDQGHKQTNKLQNLNAKIFIVLPQVGRIFNLQTSKKYSKSRTVLQTILLSYF